MKKQLLALIFILSLAAVMGACGSTADMPPTTEDTTTISEFPTEAETQAAESETTAQTEEATSVPINTASQAIVESTTRTTTTKKSTTASQTTVRTTKTTTTQRATTTTQRTITTTKRSTTTTASTQPPKTTTVNAAFDINTYINYGIAYGESIGYRHMTEVTESWDNPIAAYPAIPDTYIKDSIRGQLDFYKKTEPHVTAFHIWAEKQSDGTYDIYIARG